MILVIALDDLMLPIGIPKLLVLRPGPSFCAWLVPSSATLPLVVCWRPWGKVELRQPQASTGRSCQCEGCQLAHKGWFYQSLYIYI